jgi:hypothetical protein
LIFLGVEDLVLPESGLLEVKGEQQREKQAFEASAEAFSWRK